MSVNVDYMMLIYCFIIDVMSIFFYDVDILLGYDEMLQGEEILIFKFYSEV